MYQARIIEDSIADDVRLTTMEVTLPRIVLAEFNTHRVFSRNSASSRAIPVEKRIESVLAHPFIPDAFAANKRGMQAGETLSAIEQAAAADAWMNAMHAAIMNARDLVKVGVHKQWANRLIEPFSWTTIVCTATEWTNFFNLRISKLAQPEIRRAAELMLEAQQASTPKELRPGEWHLPYVTAEERTSTEPELLVAYSTARCARVSFLARSVDASLDVTLHDSLLTNRHMSPFEHPAQHYGKPGRFYGNFRGPWLQYRKTIEGEAVAPKEAP